MLPHIFPCFFKLNHATATLFLTLGILLSLCFCTSLVLTRSLLDGTLFDRKHFLVLWGNRNHSLLTSSGSVKLPVLQSTASDNEDNNAKISKDIKIITTSCNNNVHHFLHFPWMTCVNYQVSYITLAQWEWSHSLNSFLTQSCIEKFKC